MIDPDVLSWRAWLDEEHYPRHPRRRAARPQSLRHKVTTKQWRLAHPERYRATKKHNEATRRSRKVAWADSGAIAEFYCACPVGWHVDHIIPLKGRRVSGLHVLENLQYLPAIDNCKKGNRYAY